MRKYSPIISLLKNSRGIYSLDTSIGCKSGMDNEKNGCYNECYAAKSSKLYGYDFSKTVLRYFKNDSHVKSIVKQINNIKLDFVRVGNSGDPSENWNHTISILKKIDKCNKHIVIITKHWTLLSDEQLDYLSTINVCVNTSVSALDKPILLDKCLNEYKRLKLYCKSILRIVSCDFNLDNKHGKELNDIQLRLFENCDTIDTVLRTGKNNQLVKDGIINIKYANFLGKKTWISKFSKKTYFGKCSTCIEMCGVDVKTKDNLFPQKKGIIKQIELFKKQY